MLVFSPFALNPPIPSYNFAPDLESAKVRNCNGEEGTGNHVIPISPFVIPYFTGIGSMAGAPQYQGAKSRQAGEGGLLGEYLRSPGAWERYNAKEA
jgi:hypothetical protein